jgi:hypothetical protein
VKIRGGASSWINNANSAKRAIEGKRQQSLYNCRITGKKRSLRNWLPLAAFLAFNSRATESPAQGREKFISVRHAFGANGKQTVLCFPKREMLAGRCGRLAFPEGKRFRGATTADYFGGSPTSFSWRWRRQGLMPSRRSRIRLIVEHVLRS